jgi:hypothetical protein
VIEIRSKFAPTAPLVRLVRDAPEVGDDVEALARRAAKALPKGRNFH